MPVRFTNETPPRVLFNGGQVVIGDDGCCCDDPVPPCPACCDSPLPLRRYSVDLAGGGWTDNNADCCNEVAGAYIVEATTGCTWVYVEDPPCQATIANCPAGGGSPGNIMARLTITLQLVSDITGCRWSLNVTLTALGQNCSSLLLAAAAQYYSAYLADDESCDIVPVTLTKFSQTSTTGYRMCGGALPDSVVMTAA